MKKYSIIYADPPWRYSSRQFQDGGRRMIRLDDKYKTMTLSDICSLPLGKIVSPDSSLFLWSTNSHLPEALEVMRCWGFKYTTVAFVWVKKYQSGSFRYNYSPNTLQSVELCLLGKRGKPQRVQRNVKQLVVDEVLRHSQKPDIVAKRIVDLMGDVPRIELFARQKRIGWDVWGNEVDGVDLFLNKEKND